MITILDSPCGRGKTSYMINMINENPTASYIYITPFLNEVNRIIKETKYNNVATRFVQPTNLGSGKMNSLVNLLDNSKDIVTTHALFTNCSKDIVGKIQSGHYTLILDEVMDVVQIIPIKKEDLSLLISTKTATVDAESGLLTWEKDDYDGRFKDIMEMCKNNHVFIVNDTAIVWTFPIEIFKAFDEVYICTYLFDCQIQKYYYDLYNVEYKKVSVDNGELIPYVLQKDNLEHIFIAESGKINNIGSGKYDLSLSWYNKHTESLPMIKKNMVNFVTNLLKSNLGHTVKSKDTFWTTFKEYQSKLAGKGYAKSFAPCNLRATNDYKDRYVILYMINVFINQLIVKFFEQHNVKVDQDLYALSEMIQFIYRTRVREGKDVYCYIPSARMREIFYKFRA